MSISNANSSGKNSFYSTLGSLLCNLQNSPFMRIGASIPKDQSNKQFGSGDGLAYDPDRLFNPNKYKERQSLLINNSMNQEEQLERLKEQRKQEQEILDNIQYDMFKRNTHQEYQRQIKKMHNNIENTTNSNEINVNQKMFGVARGVCLLCRNCIKYEGCFNMFYGEFQGQASFGNRKTIQYMQCLKCHCPMNSHAPYHPNNPHSQYILRQLVKASITDSHLNVNQSIIAFKSYDPKRKGKNSAMQTLSPFPLLQTLQSVEHPAISYKVLGKQQFEIKLLKTLILKDSNQIEKGYLQALLSLLDNMNNVDMGDYEHREGKHGSWFEQLETNEIYEGINEDIKKLAKTLLDSVHDASAINEKILVLLISGNDYSALVQWLRSEQFREIHKNYELVYSTKSKRESLIACQNFFAQKFRLHHSVHILPNCSSSLDQTHKNSQQLNSARLKDILDYNNYIILKEDPKNIERSLVQKAISSPHEHSVAKINYILGQQLLNEKINRLYMKISVRVGNEPLQMPIQQIPDHLKIDNSRQVLKIQKLIYPQLSYSQRCLIIVRPFMVVQNFEEIIINLLRINKFTILHRVKIKVSEEEAEYLATIEKITHGQGLKAEYVKYMTSGVCEAILVSKRSAIYEAYALLNGSANGRKAQVRRKLRNKPIIQLDKGRDKYEYELNSGISHNQSFKPIFQSMKELVRIEKILLEKQHSSQNTHYLTNTKTGEVVKSEKLKSSSSTQFVTSQKSANNGLNTKQLPPKQKQSLLAKLPLDMFNYWCLSSKSETLTEQLCSLFIPQCTLFEPITIILKPFFMHLIQQVLSLLQQHKYFIIEAKKVLLSKIMAAELIINLQKVKIHDQNQLKKIIQVYSQKQIWIIVVSKVSGRRQIMSMLSQFEFLISNAKANSSIPSQSQTSMKAMSDSQLSSHKIQTNIGIQLGNQHEQITDQQLKDMLVPIWNSQQICLGLLSGYLGNLEEAVRILEQYSEEIHLNSNNKGINKKISQEQLPKITKSELFRVLNYFIGSFYGVGVEDLNLNTKIGRLAYYTLEQPFIAKQQSWYYSQISVRFSNYVPLLFQYRQIGGVLLCVQSDSGKEFFKVIQAMYIQQQRKIQQRLEKQLEEGYAKQPKGKKRRSLVLFLWAKKLFQFMRDLASITTDLKDYGQIWERNGQHRGNITVTAAIREEEQFLNQMQENLEDNPDIESNIKKLLQSRCLKQRYIITNCRLLPICNQVSEGSLTSFQDSIRIVQKSQTSKLKLMDLHELIDPENQHNQLNDLFTLQVFNIVPEIRTKYTLMAELYVWMLMQQFDGEIGKVGNNYGQSQKGQIYRELSELFKQMCVEIEDLQFLEYQIYLRMLVEYAKLSREVNIIVNAELANQNQVNLGNDTQVLVEKKNWIFGILKIFPNFRKARKLQNDEIAGKKRKFLDHKQYFIRKDEQNEDALQKIERKYKNIDINKFSDQVKPSVLYDPTDPLHKRLANTENRMDLLRKQSKNNKPTARNGIYVEFEKNISEKEQLLREKVKREVQKFNIRDDTQQILYETGLEKQLWYRRTKGSEQVESKQSQTDTAIQKQIGKFMQFKEEEKRKIYNKQL